MLHILIAVENKGSRLDQKDWSRLCNIINMTIKDFSGGVKLIGEFYSIPNVDYQAANWIAFLSSKHPIEVLKAQLSGSAKLFGVVINWATIMEFEYIDG